MNLTKQFAIVLHTSIEQLNLEPLGKDAPEGVMGTANYLFYYPETPENKAFVDEFKKTYNRVPKVGRPVWLCACPAHHQGLSEGREG